jgi:hypothetical protein
MFNSEEVITIFIQGFLCSDKIIIPPWEMSELQCAPTEFFSTSDRNSASECLRRSCEFNFDGS